MRRARREHGGGGIPHSAAYPQVQIHIGAFEEHAVAAGAYDFVTAATFSISALDAGRRTYLYDNSTALTNNAFGGQIVKGYLTLLYVAQKR